MTLNDRISSLSEWGDRLQNIPGNEINSLFLKAKNKNGWFTGESCGYSLNEIRKWLTRDALEQWIMSYDFKEVSAPRQVGLVMAGNIPLVGFHDFLSVLITGHKAKIKLSSQDDELLLYLTRLLLDVDSEWELYFDFVDRLKEIDAVIATGSDNSSRYFEYYFKTIPRIIRKNRTSVGIIIGEESEDEFINLAQDVFTYYGMGCRNVSKIFIPENFDLKSLCKPFQNYQEVIHHNKYANNYDYQRAVRLVSGKSFHDMGFLIAEESQELVSPISVLYYEHYANQDELTQTILKHKEKIQCVVSATGWFKGSIPFGRAQQPALNNYADGIDTIRFLTTL